MQYVALSGALDVFNLDSVEQTLRSVRNDRIVLDFTKVTVVSAAFMGGLVRLRQRLPTSVIELVGVSPSIKRIFRLVRLDRIVAFAGDAR